MSVDDLVWSFLSEIAHLERALSYFIVEDECGLFTELILEAAVIGLANVGVDKGWMSRAFNVMITNLK